MERNEWMNDQVREEIEDLRQTHGLEGMRRWPSGISRTGWQSDERYEEDGRPGEDGPLRGPGPPGMWQRAVFFDNTAQWHTSVLQHSTALQKALVDWVLRRNFPDGWGKRRVASLDEGH